MNSFMNEREFKELCEKKGFYKKKKSYYRFQGDGICQCLFTGLSYYIDPSSPWYSSKKRRSNCINVGIWSMYSKLPKIYFNPSFPKGFLDPENLIGRRQIGFMGIQEQYKIMSESGFDYLDNITTQKQLIDALEKIDVLTDLGLISDTGIFSIYGVDLCMPYIICEEKKKALQIINDRYLENKTYLEMMSQLKRGDRNEHIKREYYHYLVGLREAIDSEEKRLELMKKNYEANITIAARYKLTFQDKMKVLV